MELHERIRKRREDLSMSQAELAKRTGYTSRSSIAKIEAGVNDLTQSKISAFALALQCTTAYLMGWTDSPNECICSQKSYFDDALKLSEIESKDGKYKAIFEVDEAKMSASELSSLLALIQKISNQSGVSVEGLSMLADAASKAIQTSADNKQEEPDPPKGDD